MPSFLHFDFKICIVVYWWGMGDAATCDGWSTSLQSLPIRKTLGASHLGSIHSAQAELWPCLNYLNGHHSLLSVASLTPGLWLVRSDHVTWTLASDWSPGLTPALASKLFTQCQITTESYAESSSDSHPLSRQYSSFSRSLIGREGSRDLDTGLWLVKSGPESQIKPESSQTCLIAGANIANCNSL